MAPQTPAQAKTKLQPPLPPLLRKSMESGVICPGAVGENRMPETAVLDCVNMNFDIIGPAQLRKGASALGQNFAIPVTGLYYYSDTVDVAAPNSQLIAVAGSTAYYLSGTTWTSIRTGLTSGSKARFSTLYNEVFMANGTEATAVWDGIVADGFVTSGNASGAPTGNLIENFVGRMWMAGNAAFPSRLLWSSVGSETVTQQITWSADPTTGTQWTDISASDGESITALQRFRQYLLIFKQHHLYRVFGVGSGDPDPYWNVGTFSQESVLETKAGIYFHDATGFYLFNIYGVITEISRPMIDFIRAIPYSSYANIAGWLENDGNSVCWAIGTVTVNGVTYTNCVMRYTISTQVWTIYTMPTQISVSIRRPPFYKSNTTRIVLAADTSGNVIQLNTGTQDVNPIGGQSPIPYSLTHRWELIDALLSTRKTMMIANFSHSGGASTAVNYQTEQNDPDNLLDWSKKIGVLQSRNTGFPTIDIKARKVRIRLTGTSIGAPFIYHGYELLEVMNEYMQPEKE